MLQQMWVKFAVYFHSLFLVPILEKFPKSQKGHEEHRNIGKVQQDFRPSVLFFLNPIHLRPWPTGKDILDFE